MGVIIVTGVPGVGKSTVLGIAKDHAQMPVVIYGDEMIRVARERGVAKDRDEMRRLNPQIQREIQEEAARSIGTMGNVIVDTHCSIKTPGGYLPGIPAWVAERLKPSQILLVEAPPEAILSRRANDPTRKRDSDSVMEIAEHQSVNRAFATAVATLTGATMKIIENREGQVPQTRDAVIAALALVKPRPSVPSGEAPSTGASAPARRSGA
ncbi:MAG: adenylate kinase [Thermoplasmatota archaeon]